MKDKIIDSEMLASEFANYSKEVIDNRTKEGWPTRKICEITMNKNTKTIYQVGAFNVYEAEQTPTVLEHEKEFSDKEIEIMMKECIKEIPLSCNSEKEFIVNKLSENFGFEIVKSIFINRWDYMGI
jgi:hypothetical protein